MPNKCVVPGCNTGYASCKAKLSTFSAPKNDELRAEWRESIRLTKPLLSKHVVCEKHFNIDSVIRSYKLKDESGNVLAEVPLKCARLVTNAVPTLFPLQNQQDNKTVIEKRPDTVQASHASTDISEDKRNQRNETCLSSMFVQSFEIPAIGNDSEMKMSTDTKNRMVLTIQETPIISEPNLFIELMENPSVIQTPPNWYFATPSSKKCIALYELHWKNDENSMAPTTRRSLVIGSDMKANYLANSKRVNSSVFCFPDEFDSLANVNETLAKFASLKICCGISMLENVNLVKERVGYMDDCNQLRHNRCSIVTDKRQCEACKNVKKSISQKKLRMRKREQIKKRRTTLKEQTLPDVWKRMFRSQQCALKRARKRIVSLESITLSRRAEVNNLKEENVLRKCEELGLPNAQKMCIMEIMATARKKSPTGRWYTNDWATLCILMHMRSPNTYELLRKSGVLPVPSIRTIRR